MSLLYLSHNYIDCCSILFTILLYHYFHHLWFSIRQLRRYLYSQNKSQNAKSLRCLKPFFPKRRRVFVLIIALFCYKRLLFFSRDTCIITSNADNIEMVKVILISLWFLYCAHRNGYFANEKLCMYTSRYTKCLHQQKTVIFFHLIPGVEEKMLFLIERIIFGIIKFIKGNSFLNY